MNFKIVNIIKFFVVIMLAFSGADRINLLSNDFELEYCGSVQRASTSVGTSDLHKVQTETIAKLFKDIK